METNRIIAIIRDLTRKTVKNGCTEAEAMSAAEKVSKLLKDYNLSMDKVSLEEAICITDKILTGKRNRHPISLAILSIVHFCDCRGWSQGGVYYIFGLETDVSMAKYLYDIIYNAMETELSAFKKSSLYISPNAHRRTLSTSFLKGMAIRIAERLRLMAHKRHDEEKLVVSSGTSLVVVKKTKVDEEFTKLNLKFNSNQQKLWVHVAAYKAGKVAGNKVNINRPLRGRVAGRLENE